MGCVSRSLQVTASDAERLIPATSQGRVNALNFRGKLPGHSWLAEVILFAHV